MPAIVNTAAISEALNLTPRRIEQLVHEGMPRLGRGRYDVWACAQWYIRYLQRAIERRATENGDDTKSNITQEKKRLIRLQADMAEVELRQKTGELIPAHLVDDKFVTFAGTIHDRFLAMPSQLAGRLEHESKEVIRVKLYETVRDTLNRLSNDLQGKLPASKHDEQAKKTGSKRKQRRAPFTSIPTRRTKARRRS